MYLVRDIMHCKPGQVRPMVQKFLALSKLIEQAGYGKMRIVTDVAAERYWTVISEMEAESLEQHTEVSRQMMKSTEFQAAMAGYHDLVVDGRREIFQIEG